MNKETILERRHVSELMIQQSKYQVRAVIFAGSDKFNERELETFIKKKERELILLHVHVVLIYYFYLGFNQSLRYNFICMSSFPTGMTGHLYKRCL